MIIFDTFRIYYAVDFLNINRNCMLPLALVLTVFFSLHILEYVKNKKWGRLKVLIV